MGIPSLDQTLEAVAPDNYEGLFFVLSVIAGFILLLHEGTGLGWSLVFAPVVALPIALLFMLAYLLFMLAYLLLVPVILLIVCVLQAFAAMHAMLRRPSP